MALFQRSFYGEEPTFSNLFRMLDDFENYSREVQSPQGRTPGRRHHRAFNPRFDVRETDTAYELHGELPGIDRKDVQIEFPEPQTMTVRGRVERTYTSGTPPAGLVEDTTMSGAITESGESPKETTHQASVSDEETEAAKEKGEASTEVAPKKEEQPKPKERYWHQERSVGEFHRTFTFPTRVDETGVSATLNNGILSVTVPKAAKRSSRRIAVN